MTDVLAVIGRVVVIYGAMLALLRLGGKIEDGRVCEDVLRAQRLTADQLATALHEQGLLSVREVRRAYVEPSGDITFIKASG